MVYYIGVMSGTSLDGIDVVLVNFDEKDESKFTVEKSYTHEIPEQIKKDILSICQGQETTLSKIGDLDKRLGILYAKAINEMISESGINSNEIKAIGCHGQTVHHEPDNGFTIQLGDCNRIVSLTNITTIGDFRRRDMSYGGQGAPLVPSFHKSFLLSSIENRVILNIGGISNITILIPNLPVKGYDTGPGNILLDSWISLKQNVSYDKNGEWAKQGNTNEPLLTQLLNSTDYFNKQSPKSTGRELFNISWLLNILSSYIGDNVISDVDVQATLLEFTCITIVNEIIKIGSIINKVLVCGGGFKNTYLMQRLSSLLHSKCNGCLLSSVDDYGVSSQDMEAVAFAYFAKNTINKKPSNLCEVTNASRETILGSIYLKND